VAYSSSPEGQLNGLQVQNRHPALRNQTLLGYIQVEQVQCVVNGFNLAHFNEPVLDVLCSSNQDSVSVVLGLPQNLQTKLLHEEYRLVGCGAVWVYTNQRFGGTPYMDSIIMEVFEAELHSSIRNRDVVFGPSKSWKHLTCSLKKSL
jgi:hypothetical protein